MWSEELDMSKVLFNIPIGNQEYKFTRGIWSEEPDMTKVLFNIHTGN